MQLKDLKQQLSTMTDEELLAHVQAIRTNREIVRVGRKTRVERVERKESRKTEADLVALFHSMSEADQAEFLAKLGDTE